MTCMTFLTSSPRAETPVATKIGDLAVRKARLGNVKLVNDSDPQYNIHTKHPHVHAGYDLSGLMYSEAPCYTNNRQGNQPGICY
jgi:hypothetical protein